MSSIIPFPSILFSSVELSLQRAGQVLRSRYSGKRQSLVWPYALWTAEAKPITYDQFSDTEVRALRAFLVDLEGQVNIFRVPLIGAEKPSTNYLGAEGVVAGAGQIGKAINTSGWANNTLIARRGDWVSINDELKMLMADATTSATGTVTLSIKPAMRKAAPNGTAVKLRNITVLMSATKDDVAKWSMKYPLQYEFAPLSMIEVYE